MDSDRPAYWLDRSPAEAAEFLARTAVASRRVGGFVKRAAPDWQAALNQLGASVAGNKPLQHALIGAGIGGAGGLGLGLLNRKRKSPWATALTGAALGGLGAGAGSYLYHNPPDKLFDESPWGADARRQEDVNRALAHEQAPAPERLATKVLDKAFDTVPAGTALQGALDKDRFLPLAAKATGSGAVAGLGHVFGHDAPTIGLTATAAGVTGAADAALRQQATRFDEARRAAQAFGAGLVGHRTNVPSTDMALGQIGRVVAGTGNNTTSRWGRLPGVNDVIRAAREARIGRQILDLKGQPADITTVPTPRGTNLNVRPFAPQQIADVLHAGGFNNPPPAPSGLRRTLSRGGTVASQLLANLAAKTISDKLMGR